MVKKPPTRKSTAAALAEPPEPQSATGRYPGAVWAQAYRKKTLGVTEDAPPDAPTATGRYPQPVWSAPASLSLGAGDGTLDSSLRVKEPDYADEVGAAPDAETPEAEPGGTLDNREIYRIVREVAIADSGDDLYAAVNPQEGFGLCFGLLLFAQAPGHLGTVLQLMQSRDDATFRATFGDQSDDLLAVTNADSAAERLAAVGGDDLSSTNWLDRFRKAGAIATFQAAQNEQAIEGLFRPMLRYAAELGINTDRSLAFFFDRVVTKGLGGAVRWLIQAAGPLRTSEHRLSALQTLGFDDLKEFQASTGWISPTGVFGPDTHVALVGALRRAGETLLPRPQDYMCRMLSAARGPAKARLMRLRDSEKLEDVIYRLDTA